MGVRIREKPQGSGVWWLFINHHGRRKSKMIGRDKKLAREVAEKISAKQTLGDFGIASGKKTFPAFKELAKQWLELHIKPNMRATTYDRYSGLLKNYLYKKLASVPIDQVSRAEVIGALRWMRTKGLSRSSIEQARNVISGVCEFAIDGEYITENPCVGVMRRLGMPRCKSREPVDIFTADEVALILETCRKMRLDFYPIFLTAFRTGMRIGEVLALRWDDVNWRNRYILVQRSFRNSRLTPTKNGKTRKVDISDQLYFALKRLSAQRKEEALKDGLGEPVSIIFHTKGDHTSQNSVRNIWRRLLTKCELNYRKLHTSRHTFASMLISNGESLAYVKELLGHHSIQITVDVYGHLLPTENRAAVNALDDTPIRTPGATTQKEKAVTP